MSTKHLTRRQSQSGQPPRTPRRDQPQQPPRTPPPRPPPTRPPPTVLDNEPLTRPIPPFLIPRQPIFFPRPRSPGPVIRNYLREALRENSYEFMYGQLAAHRSRQRRRRSSSVERMDLND
ncbi:hypothetical protein QBC46DRAFT_345074 [Diplogelasinospora grovesii]|uniref:Uncharacterized protein n=1 Tax=Diplogelasinospora grovesii TaxID=303347 RepID=A0AAN6N234_9PEZI|nr:hypothetical protein QBC46DRAFT_345074 [Diplogelasinospora grovesii]